jgi:hypothetical protein
MFHDKRKKHKTGKWAWGEGELSEFLLSETKMCQSKPILLLIDALDECNESGVRKVVSFLEALSINAIDSRTTLKICLSSRHYPNIYMDRKIELVVERQGGHYQDIVKYARNKLRIRDCKIEKELVHKAAGVFMWVVLVVEMLNQAYDDGDVRAMEKKFCEVPSDLEEVFWTLLGRDNQDKQVTILILQWVLFARRLLKPEELYFAILARIETERLGAWDRSRETSEIIERFITTHSKGLVEIRQGHQKTVQFIHGSVNDFLLRNERLQRLDPELAADVIGISHDCLKACCLSYLTMRGLPLAWDRSHAKELGFYYPFLQYASTYVTEHAENAHNGCLSLYEFINVILRTSFNIPLSLDLLLLCILTPIFCLVEAWKRGFKKLGSTDL